MIALEYFISLISSGIPWFRVKLVLGCKVYPCTLWYILVPIIILWFTLVHPSTLWYNFVHTSTLLYTLVQLYPLAPIFGNGLRSQFCLQASRYGHFLHLW